MRRREPVPNTASQPTTPNPTTVDRDFSTCERLNDTIQVIVGDYQAGRVDGHTGLIQHPLGTVHDGGARRGRFSSVIACEMADTDRALRAARY